jgi:peptidoglycan/LPS O-acetylase OafA/YrhL
MMKGVRNSKSGYLPSLDGLRAVAILSVICYHDRVHRFGILSTSWIHQYGSLGVDLFFAISGILICSRLLEEERVSGKISLRGFYIRRLFRIFPPAWLFLFTYLGLSLLRQLPIDIGGVVTSFLMVRNLWVHVAGDVPRTWYTIHFWSLSVEEHFYILLPGLLVLFRNKRAFVLALLSCAVMVWITIVFHYPFLQTQGFTLRTDMRLDALLIPATFAVLLTRPEIRGFAVRWLHPWLAALAFVGVFVLFQSVPSRLVNGAAGFVISIGFPLVVIATTLHPRSISCRILEWSPLRFVGRISFSLYLWQQLFFPNGHTPGAWPFSIVQRFPMNYVAAFACAIASYYLVERPMIRVGHRLAHPPTPGHEDLEDPPGKAKLG